MKTVDGHTCKWILKSNNDLEIRSSLHLQARSLLKEVFPTLNILEEVPIPVFRTKTLFFDFYIPLKNVAVEIHGEQHTVFRHFFHRSKLKFLKQKYNDKLKVQWCSINNIELIILWYNESNEQWKSKFAKIKYRKVK